MNKFAYAVISRRRKRAGPVAIPAAAQAESKPISMGIKLMRTPAGPAVGSIAPDRTGAALGFKVGDLLLDSDGKPITPQVLEAYMDGKEVGDELSFKVKRGETVIELKGKGLAAPEAIPGQVTDRHGWPY